MIQILGLLGSMHFDAVVVEVKTFLLLFRLALAILCVPDNLCTKQGNSSIFESKICGFKSRAGSNGARTVIIYDKMPILKICRVLSFPCRN